MIKTKKQYYRPNKKDIVPGKIVPIYENYKEEKGLLGYAIINKEIDSIYNERTYVRIEIGSIGSKKEPDTVIWKYNRYNVTYVDPLAYDSKMSLEMRMKYIHQVGFTTAVYIAYFHKVSSLYFSI